MESSLCLLQQSKRFSFCAGSSLIIVAQLTDLIAIIMLHVTRSYMHVRTCVNTTENKIQGK